MKHETHTYNTKKALAEALKRFLQKRSLSKITVSDLVMECGMNRKTFYYHFHDIYDLLKLMFEQEAIEIVGRFDLITDYNEAVDFIMDYIEENDHMINCVYDSMGRDELKRFFFNDFIGIARSIVTGAEKELDAYLDDEFREFLVRFYTEAIAGIMVEWLKEDIPRDRQKTTDYIFLIFRQSLPAIIRKRKEDTR